MTIILDSGTRSSLEEEWKSLRMQQAKLTTYILAAQQFGASWLKDLEDSSHSLFLPFAFSVLEHTLQSYRDAGTFRCKQNAISKLMEASKDVLPWVGYAELEAARDVRNCLAHEQKAPARFKTESILDAIERELIAFSILAGPIRYNFSIRTTAA
jgi:hypothetical protein